MYRRYIPLLLMLTAGAVTCVIAIVRQYTMLQQMLMLFVVLVLFYLLGSIIKWTLDFFDRQNEKSAGETGEVIAILGEGKEDDQN